MQPPDQDPDEDDPLDALPGDDDLSDQDDAPDELDALAQAASDGALDPEASPRHPYKPAMAADGRIDSDLVCLQCEYNLRGQLPEGTCPECGTPVSYSMRSDRLSLADFHWLRTVRRGTTLLIVAGFSIITLSCLINGALTAMMDQSATGSQLAAVMRAVPQALFAIGLFMLTAPEPGVIRPRLSRPLARWTATPGYTIMAIGLLVIDNENRNVVLTAGVLTLAGAPLAVFGFCTALIYLSHLARRVPNRGLAKQATIVFWGWVSIVVLLILGFVLTSVVPGPVGFDIQIYLLVFCPLSIAGLTFFIWWLVVISTFSRCFDQAIKTARQRARAARTNPPQAPLRPTDYH